MKTKTLIGMVVMLMALAGITANAAAPERKMLEEGKTWVYVYHDVEGVDDPSSYHPMWSVYYQLNTMVLSVRMKKVGCICMIIMVMRKTL